MAGLVPAIHVLNTAKTWMPGMKPGMTREQHDRLPHPSPDADALPQLSQREFADPWRRGGAGGTERRRQDQLHRGDLAAGGLRRATDASPISGWGVRRVEGALGLATLGTGIDPPGSEGAATSRRCRIDREPVGSAAAFGDHLRMVWLTPTMDGLFLGAASERRRFFDRLVLAIDSEHSAGCRRSTALGSQPALEVRNSSTIGDRP